MKKSQKRLLKLIGGVILPVLLLLGACGGGSKDVVKIGVTGDSKAWDYVIEEAKKEGIEIELVKFTDYPQPNKALANGEININSFQHYAYLNKEKEEFGYDLTVIGETSIAPMGIYSDTLDSLDAVKGKKDAKVLIPDDVTNGGRALQLLETHGLIKLGTKGDEIPSLKDVVENKNNLDITELAAANIPAALRDVDFAVINSGVAADSIGTPSEKSIVLESVADTKDNPYINVIVVQTLDKDNETYKKIVELYQSDEVKKIIEEDSKGSSFPVW